MLELVWDAFRKHGQWPIYQYEEGCFAAHGLDPLAVLGSFSMVGRTGTQQHCQAIWFASQGGAPPRHESHVCADSRRACGTFLMATMRSTLF